MNPRLTGLSETTLIPLWARAAETRRPDAIIHDPSAVDLVQALDYNFGKFEKAWMTQIGIAVRTWLLDQTTRAFIQLHPRAVIINLGAGLDTRFLRVDNGVIRWYEVDLPEVIEVRRRFFQESDRYKFISKSLLDFSWGEEVGLEAESILIIIEGVLLYWEAKDVRALFDHLTERFPQAEVLFDLLGPTLVGKGRYHDAVSKIPGVEFRWSLPDNKELERWNPKFKFIEEWYLTDYYRKRWGWFGWVTSVPLLKRKLSNRIVRFRLEG